MRERERRGIEKVEGGYRRDERKCMISVRGINSRVVEYTRSVCYINTIWLWHVLRSCEYG